jgi:hypothetical protein
MSESMSPKSLKIVVVILSLFLIWGLVMNNKKQISYDKQLSIKCDSIQHVADSIHNKSYEDEIELNRYQIAFEIFLKRNPKAAEEYSDIISNETE